MVVSELIRAALDCESVGGERCHMIRVIDLYLCAVPISNDNKLSGKFQKPSQRKIADSVLIEIVVS